MIHPALSESRGWFKAMRCDEALELIKKNPNAFVLAYVIAYRARWRAGFNRHGLEQGEAALGDFENYGMTRQQYRTAMHQLDKWQFATFKTTNAGTVGKLIDSRLFSTSKDDEQPTIQPPSNHRATTEQPLTKKEIREEGNLNALNGESSVRRLIRGNKHSREYVPLDSENDFMIACRTLFSRETMSQYGGAWRNRYRADKDKSVRVMRECLRALKEKEEIKCYAAYANDLFTKRFK